MAAARHVVTVDTIGSVSAETSGYKASAWTPDRWDKLVKDHSMKCVQSPVGTLCGLDLKVYFKKWAKGLGLLRLEGEAAMGRALAGGLMASNNGAATFLCVKPEDGLSDYVVQGKAWVVLDDGRTPLTAGQVWGLVEMINIAMDTYDMEPQNMRRGKEKLVAWGDLYKQRKWKPSSGTGGVDIYGPLATQACPAAGS